MPNTLIDVVNERIAAQVEQAQEGKIVKVSLKEALVQRKGSASLVPCLHDNLTTESVGKRCVIQWIKQRKRYVIMSVYNSAVSGLPPGNQAPTAFELFPPAHLSASNALPNYVLLSWDTPPQQLLTFEVQQNSTPDDEGAFTIATTHGALALAATTEPAYFRVRSIAPTFEQSSWSEWLLGEPGAVTETGVATVTATAPLSSTEGADPIISHDDSGVAPGTYSSVTVDAKGHVTDGDNPPVVTEVTASSPLASDGGANPNISHEESGVEPGTYTQVVVDAFGHVVEGANPPETTGITNVTASSPLASSGGETPEISHEQSGVTPGTYTQVEVDAFGHVTAGANPTAITGVTDVTATAPLASTGGPTPVLSHDPSGVTPGIYSQVEVDALGHVVGGENPILARLRASDLLTRFEPLVFDDELVLFDHDLIMVEVDN